MIKRELSKKLADYIKPNKVTVIYGPRRVGKTTLVDNYLKAYKGKVYKSTGEDMQLKLILESRDFSKIIPFFSKYDLIFIDEAQYIDKVGMGLKIIVDQIPEISVIATGSSSFDLSNKVGEPLVGRQNVIYMYPVSSLELSEDRGNAYLFTELENLLIYGSYPEVISNTDFSEKVKYLVQIRDSYLLKDILMFDEVRNSKKIIDLLALLAFQIGQEVSLQELGNNLGMSKNTVGKYIDLLEKVFVLINLRGYSRNLRKEVTKTSRYYFWDLGVRNAVINNFNFLDSRDDIGQLWENFLFIERYKRNHYKSIYSNYYFWRTWDQKEVDLVEERDGRLYGFEFKWGKKMPEAPKDWINTYKNASYQVINRDNYFDFVC